MECLRAPNRTGCRLHALPLPCMVACAEERRAPYPCFQEDPSESHGARVHQSRCRTAQNRATTSIASHGHRLHALCRSGSDTANRHGDQEESEGHDPGAHQSPKVPRPRIGVDRIARWVGERRPTLRRTTHQDHTSGRAHFFVLNAQLDRSSRSVRAVSGPAEGGRWRGDSAHTIGVQAFAAATSVSQNATAHLDGRHAGVQNEQGGGNSGISGEQCLHWRIHRDRSSCSGLGF